MAEGTDEGWAGTEPNPHFVAYQPMPWIAPAAEFVRIGDAAIRRSAITSVAVLRGGKRVGPAGGAVHDPDLISGVHICTVAEEFTFDLGACRPGTFEDALAFAEKALAQATKGA